MSVRPSNETDHRRHLTAFNARHRATLVTFFNDDSVLENAEFSVQGKSAFSEKFHAFSYECCLEDGRFSELHPAMSVIALSGPARIEFLILYKVQASDLIHPIKGATWPPGHLRRRHKIPFDK